MPRFLPGRQRQPLNPSRVLWAGAEGSGSVAQQLLLSTVASDNFDRANGAIAGSNNWLATTEGGPSITTNQIVGGAAGLGAFRTAETYGNDQFAQVAVGSIALPSGAYIGVSVRNQDNANNYTAIYFNNGGTPQLQLYKRVAGVFTQLGPTATLPGVQTQGTVLQLTVQGSVLAAQVGTPSGTLPLIALLDATFATGGSPGIEMVGVGSLDNFVCGNVSTPALPAAKASDNFNAGTAVSTDGQAWSIMAYSPAVGATVDCPIVASQINYSTVTVHGGDTRNDTGWNSDQAAVIQAGTVPPSTGSGFVGATTRNQSGGTKAYLAVMFQNNAYQIYRLDQSGGAGTGFSTLLVGAATIGSDPAGTSYTLVSQGTRHSFRLNGKEIFAVTDAAFSGGTPGLMMFATATADNWSGSNL